MARKPPRTPRAERRARARAHEELVHDLEALARRKPGGTPELPQEVASSAQVDVIANATPCPLCDGTQHLEQHAADTHGGERLRVVSMRCTVCGVRRTYYFRVVERVLH